MILSRLDFNPLHRATYQLADDPYRLHIKLCACAQRSRAEANILYRWDEGPILLVQCDEELDWSKLDVPEKALRREPQSKCLAPSFTTGQRLQFRLRCRPSKKVNAQDHKNSRYRTLRTDEERLEWLSRQGRNGGFLVESVEMTRELWNDTQPIKSERDDPQSRRKIGATRFDGVLVVTDPSRLIVALRKGIGPQKAYGFGLLSLASAK